MKILYLAQVLPYPLDAGPKVRMYYMLRYLAQRHQVTLVSFIRSDKELAHVEHLRSFCHVVHTVPMRRSRARDVWFLLRSLTSPTPFLIARDHVPEMHARLRQLVAQGEFDVIHADQLAMAQYAEPYGDTHKVLDQHNAVWTIVKRMAQTVPPGPYQWWMQHEMRKMQHYEARICGEFNQVLAVTEEDRRSLTEVMAQHVVSPQQPIRVLPICIDPDAVARVERNTQARHIVFVGGMFYPPNVDGVLWFAREVWPLIRLACPDTQFWVIGTRPASEVVRLGVEDPHIRILGYVDELGPYLRACAVFLVPLRVGGGMRVKILDAWARGVAIVSTSIGCEGIDTGGSETICIADAPADFAHAVLRILSDPALETRLAANGRMWVEQNFDWRRAYTALDAVYPPPEQKAILAEARMEA